MQPRGQPASPRPRHGAVVAGHCDSDHASGQPVTARVIVPSTQRDVDEHADHAPTWHGPHARVGHLSRWVSAHVGGHQPPPRAGITTRRERVRSSPPHGDDDALAHDDHDDHDDNVQLRTHCGSTHDALRNTRAPTAADAGSPGQRRPPTSAA